jgi:hypothetical protein
MSLCVLLVLCRKEPSMSCSISKFKFVLALCALGRSWQPGIDVAQARVQWVLDLEASSFFSHFSILFVLTFLSPVIRHSNSDQSLDLSWPPSAAITVHTLWKPAHSRLCTAWSTRITSFSIPLQPRRRISRRDLRRHGTVTGGEYYATERSGRAAWGTRHVPSQ